MASIKEYFDKAFEHVVTGTKKVTVGRSTDDKAEVIVQIHFDFDAPARYLSIFVPNYEHWRNTCEFLLTQSATLLNMVGIENVRLPPPRYVYGGFYVANVTPVEITASPLCEPRIPAKDLPFTGTVFIYSENEVSIEDVNGLKAFGLGHGIRLRWRGVDFARERSLVEKPLAFISHDARDKDAIARPLALRLQQMICPVWFDEYSLVVGDSLRGKIEKGLKECSRCILILSPNFLTNQGWTKAEFDSVFTREILLKQDVMLPVWCGVTAKEVYEYSPRLADKVGVNWNLGEEEVSRRLYNTIASATLVPTHSKWQGS